MKLLDLFCGAGGCSAGYARAGFDVTGVDIEHHPDYPFQMLTKDAMAVLADVDYLDTFDAIHASPPCQASTTMSNRWRGKGGKTDEHINLIPDVRNFLEQWGGVWVIENVPGARKSMCNPVVYSGGYFGLKVERPRLFESNIKLTPPPRVKVDEPLGIYGKLDGRRLFTRKDGSIQRAAKTLLEGQSAMGIDWMAWEDLTESIPPAYTKHIGEQLTRHLNEEREAVA